MTEQEERELKDRVDRLTAALEKATQPPPVRTVKTEELHNGTISLADLATGAVKVDMPEPEPEEPRQLKDTEIRRSDYARINRHVADIAAGRYTIVD